MTAFDTHSAWMQMTTHEVQGSRKQNKNPTLKYKSSLLKPLRRFHSIDPAEVMQVRYISVYRSEFRFF